MVQNSAVRLISDTFRTTPCDPLHQLLNILPMNLWLNMIVQNFMIRLYRVPKASQLLKRLEGAWHTPDPNDLPLPAPIGNKVKTTLHKLATRVLANGPHIKAFPETPPRHIKVER